MFELCCVHICWLSGSLDGEIINLQSLLYDSISACEVSIFAVRGTQSVTLEQFN